MLGTYFIVSRGTLSECLGVSDAESDHGVKVVATRSLYCKLYLPLCNDQLLGKVILWSCANDTFFCHPFHLLLISF